MHLFVSSSWLLHQTQPDSASVNNLTSSPYRSDIFLSQSVYCKWHSSEKIEKIFSVAKKPSSSATCLCWGRQLVSEKTASLLVLFWPLLEMEISGSSWKFLFIRWSQPQRNINNTHRFPVSPFQQVFSQSFLPPSCFSTSFWLVCFRRRHHIPSGLHQ